MGYISVVSNLYCCGYCEKYCIESEARFIFFMRYFRHAIILSMSKILSFYIYTISVGLG